MEETRFWDHKVSEAWLRARRRYLTASEIHELLPAYRRAAKAGSPTDPAFVMLAAKKLSLVPDDPWSPSQAAARGHVMEPYAVSEYNESRFCASQMYHWDDCLIHSGSLAFSPDALNVPQVPGTVNLEYDTGRLFSEDRFSVAPTEILEIKSYAPDQWIKRTLTDRMELDERYQVACAQLVVPEITHMSVMFYCPEIERFHIVEYRDDDLEEERQTVAACLSMYLEAKDKLAEILEGTSPTSMTEEQIYQDYCMQQMMRGGR